MARIPRPSVCWFGMQVLQKISGGLVVAAFAFIMLSPILGVHVHDNGTVHSHTNTAKHNHSDQSIPQNEIPSLLLKVVFNKGLPLEFLNAFLFLVFALFAVSMHRALHPQVMRSFSVGSIRDGTLILPSPPRRIVGQRAPPTTPSLV